MAKDDNYTSVLLEDIRSQVQTVLEISIDTRNKMNDLPTRDEFSYLKSDIGIIKQAITDTNKNLKLLERRTTRLEQKSV